MNIPIVIAAYNRENTLFRLLLSIAKANYVTPVKLIISIDGGGSENVKIVARKFEWEFGPKEIIEHSENFGLRRHILLCGGLSKLYDGIILLEDDLYVSPWFYQYASAALKFYQYCSSICGISLYSYRYNETSMLPFIPLNDASNTFFMQVPCSWGQAWLKEHWDCFAKWYISNNDNFSDDVMLPGNIAFWPETSWKKYFFKYMIEKDLYFVYPFWSYTTNFGDKGQHHCGSNLFQVPIVLEKISKLVFKRFEESLIKYDAWCELLPECLNYLSNGVFNLNFSVDLHGTKRKENLPNEYVLTAKKSNSCIQTFGRQMLPVEMNIINKICGNDIYLTAIDQIKDYGNINDSIFERAIDITTQQYYYTMESFHHTLLNRALARNEEQRMEELERYKKLFERNQDLEQENLRRYQLELALRQSIKQLLTSMSWRVTSPLRWVARKINNIINQKDN